MDKIMGRAASRLGVAVITAIVTTTVIAGGVAWASVANNSVTTAKIRNGAVTTAKLANNAVTSAKIKNGTITQADLAPALASQLPRFAHIDADDDGASVISGRGLGPVVDPVVRMTGGSYQVTFAAPVTDCGITATLSDNTTGAATPGEITVERDSANQVRVRTFDSAGVAEDRNESDGFMVTVVC